MRHPFQWPAGMPPAEWCTMSKLSLLLVAVSPIAVALAFQSPSGQVKAHADKLQAATSLSLTVTIQPIGGSPEEQTFQFAKPNLLRWESSAKLVCSDGKTLWTYNKAEKTYSEEPAPAEGAWKMLGDTAWTWIAFFDSKFADQIGSAKLGRARKFKGVAIKEVELALARRPDVAAILFLDDAGVGRGVLWKSTAGGAVKETILFADKMEIGQPIPADTFAFAPPSGAKKVEKASAAEGSTFKDVHAIFMGNCAGCHGTRERRGGLNLTSYESVMAGSRSGKVVIAGDPDASPIMLHLRANGRAVMPPSGMMPEAVVGKVAKWIADGAKP